MYDYVLVDSKLIVMKEGEKGTERGTKGVRSHGIILCHVQNPHGHFLKSAVPYQSQSGCHFPFAYDNLTLYGPKL